jgi:hypothetical protein
LFGIGLLLAPAFAQTPRQTLPKPKRPVFLRAERSVLTLGNVTFRNIGVNLPDFFQDCLSGNTANAESLLVRAKNAGVRVVRCAGILSTAASVRLLQSKPERWHAAFARMLTLADAQGILIIPTLLPRYDTWVSVLPSPAPSGSSPLTQGSVNAQVLADVTTIVTRYRDDQRVLFWEIADGWNRDADQAGKPTTEQIRAFSIQAATAIKRIDRKHLVSPGNADMMPDQFHRSQTPPTTQLDNFRQYAEILATFSPPPCDFVSVQQFPPGTGEQGSPNEGQNWLIYDNLHAFALPWTRNAAERIDRPLFISAFGSQNPFLSIPASQAWLKDFLKRLEIGVAPLACLSQADFEDAETTRDLAAANAAILIELTGEAINRR